MQTVAALTIMRDDAFSLKAWLRHYGGQIGRENCYLVSTGADSELHDMAQGCSIIRLPGGFAENIDRKRGRILNNFVAALRCYFTHVIVGEPGELVVVDPQAGDNLRGFLETMPPGRVLTPLGFELIRHVETADDPAKDGILNRSCYLRLAPELCKPCVLSIATSLSRNGQFSRYGTLITPDPLYLLNVKHCAPTTISQSTPDLTEMRGEFVFSDLRARMHETWKKRDASSYWNFDLPEDDTFYRLPERFWGMF